MQKRIAKKSGAARRTRRMWAGMVLRAAGRPPRSTAYCTFAVTVDEPVNVNVQVLLLLPPLEQAPDQMASRPFDTPSVMLVPDAKDAAPLLPVLTLMPDGVDVTR